MKGPTCGVCEVEIGDPKVGRLQDGTKVVHYHFEKKCALKNPAKYPMVKGAKFRTKFEKLVKELKAQGGALNPYAVATAALGGYPPRRKNPSKGRKWIAGAIKRPGALIRWARQHGALKPGGGVDLQRAREIAEKEGNSRVLKEISLASTLRSFQGTRRNPGRLKRAAAKAKKVLKSKGVRRVAGDAAAAAGVAASAEVGPEAAEAGMAARKAIQGNPAKSEQDLVAAHELVLYIENHPRLSPSGTGGQGVSIAKNLLGKMKKGTFDADKSVTAFEHLAESGAKAYAKEFATPREWNTIFTASTRRAVALELASGFIDRARAGDFGKTGAQKNPKRVPLERGMVIEIPRDLEVGCPVCGGRMKMSEIDAHQASGTPCGKVVARSANAVLQRAKRNPAPKAAEHSLRLAFKYLDKGSKRTACQYAERAIRQSGEDPSVPGPVTKAAGTILHICREESEKIRKSYEGLPANLREFLSVASPRSNPKVDGAELIDITYETRDGQAWRHISGEISGIPRKLKVTQHADGTATVSFRTKVSRRGIID